MQVRLNEIAALLDLTPESRVLDIGAGPGMVAAALSGMAGSWTMLELNADLLKMAKQAAPGAVGILGDFEDTEIEGTFDRILLASTMQYFADPDSAVKKIVGLLEPGGAVVFTQCPSSEFREEMEKSSDDKEMHRRRRFFPAVRFLHALRNLGLEGFVTLCADEVSRQYMFNIKAVKA